MTSNLKHGRFQSTTSRCAGCQKSLRAGDDSKLRHQGILNRPRETETARHTKHCSYRYLKDAGESLKRASVIRRKPSPAGTYSEWTHILASGIPAHRCGPRLECGQLYQCDDTAMGCNNAHPNARCFAMFGRWSMNLSGCSKTVGSRLAAAYVMVIGSPGRISRS